MKNYFRGFFMEERLGNAAAENPHIAYPILVYHQFSMKPTVLKNQDI
jgi:hypothetical protein